MAKCLRCGAGNEWLRGDIKPEDQTEIARLQAEVERLKAFLSESHRSWGALCAVCGFRYMEFEGHIKPCPLCAEKTQGDKIATLEADLAELRTADDLDWLDKHWHHYMDGESVGTIFTREKSGFKYQNARQIIGLMRMGKKP